MAQSCAAARAKRDEKAGPVGAHQKLMLKCFIAGFSAGSLSRNWLNLRSCSPSLNSRAHYTGFSVSRSLTVIWEKWRRESHQEMPLSKNCTE